MRFLIVFAVFLATTNALFLHENRFDVEPQGRITNGQESPIGKFPYQVGLLLKLVNLKYNWCGGSLIGKEWILTAAHCTDGVAEVTVYLGSTIRQVGAVTHKVTPKNIIAHKGWSLKTLRNDIALIKIPATSYSSLIKPVKLPALGSSYSTYKGESVIASGWGAISDSSPGVTKNLQWARMQVITNTACSRSYPSSITSSHVCIATTGGIAPCGGDSGGPLVLESSQILIGVTSFGAEIGCTKGFPDVFTRITSYLEWIQSHTGISY